MSEPMWTITDGVLTITDPNTGNTNALRFMDGRIEHRVVAPYETDWSPWSHEGVFYAVKAWFINA